LALLSIGHGDEIEINAFARFAFARDSVTEIDSSSSQAIAFEV